MNYDYLIIGGGMTAAAAVEGIREVDSAGSVGLISAESDAPYDRPPLSKALWKDKPLDIIWRNTGSKGATLHLGKIVKSILPEQKQVIDDKGTVFGYRKLLLATGGVPRRFAFDNDRIIYFRNLSDYRRLRALTGTGRRFAVIGGGFIGSEIAAALAMNGKEVAMIFPGKNIGERIFPEPLARFVSDYYRQKGVELFAGDSVTGIEDRGTRCVLKTGANREIEVDGVVAGIGISPDIELARSIGLLIEDGIVVDEFLRTSRPDIFSAGDVAAFINPALGKRVRVEHEDNANTMGRSVGRNMAGNLEPYHHLPLFYSDMFELGYEAVGELDSRMETFADWKNPNEKGVVYYLQNGRVRGVLLWNVWKQVKAARQLIAEPGPFTAENLTGRLPAKAMESKPIETVS